jgi:FlaA1/EpsC-like NDP-sugar epimerase
LATLKGFDQKLLHLPRLQKRALALVVDIVAAMATVAAAHWLRLDALSLPPGPNIWAYLLAPAIAIPVMVSHGLYRAVFRYTDLSAFRAIAQACAIYGVLYALIIFFGSLQGVPRTVGIIQPVLFFLAVAGSRALVKFFLGGQYQAIVARQYLPKVLIYGAGNAGRQIAASLSQGREFQLAGFADEEPALWGSLIDAKKVFSPAELPALIERESIAEVLLAMPSATRAQRQKIVSMLAPYPVHVRTLPRLSDVVGGKVSVEDIQELEIEDLLDRDSVNGDTAAVQDFVTEKVVLVTGAAGSIGSEICRQVLALGPAKLVLLDHSEPGLYEIHKELAQRLESAGTSAGALHPTLASVKDEERLRVIFESVKPQVVFHAAAYKHVPIVEDNPVEGVLNNVFGTLACARAAVVAGVAHFVLVSTDKAVRPTNVMGASKRLAEMVLQALGSPRAEGPRDDGGPRGNPVFSMVRFGNVLGSSGSVVPLFRQQIRDGGPVTVTHPEVTRYFMTIPEATQLVLNAGAMSQGGEVFVLDMGEPVKIMDLARKVIQLSGLTVRDAQFPDGDIEITITGLRPGEKLYEELLIGDNPEPSEHPRIMKAREEFLPWAELEPVLEELRAAATCGDGEAIRKILMRLVSGYSPAG